MLNFAEKFRCGVIAEVLHGGKVLARAHTRQKKSNGQDFDLDWAATSRQHRNMPPRVARSSIQSIQPAKTRPKARNPKKAAKRALNAFSIAHYENPEKIEIRKNRLGQVDPAFNRKRSRDDEDKEDDHDEEEPAELKRRKRRSGDESFDEGSDSEGNTWQMGHVDNDDDEDIDSDEAFGESDEERFEGYTFRGSSTNQRAKAKKPRRRELEDEDGDIDLNGGESAEGEDEEDADLGEDAIDLATALDQYEDDEAEEKKEKARRKKVSAFDDTDESPSEAEDAAADSIADVSSDEDEEDEEDRQAQLKDLISSLATEEESKSRGRRVELHESALPDEFAIARKVDLLSFKPKAANEETKRALKLLRDDKSSKRNDIARKLDAPLPKRQQDKIDRAAANAKTNETLERWTDTIKHNRRAEHLMFPLQHKDGGRSQGEKTLQPTTTSAPASDLERTIQAILQQSGLSNGKEDEEQIQKWEELQTNKLPIEEVMKRRAQLRMERELLFREEVRAKRIKKIKSKAYRRIHRKERERLLEKERDQLKADGVDLSEEEREYNDRRRAEERMGAKHRESKWAKGIKATGRAAWDQDALDGVTEMARRNEELRRRVEGKTIRNQDEEASDLSSEEDESEDDDDEKSDDAALQRSLGKLKHNPFSTDTLKLGQMAFMQKADAARRAQNDEAVEQMRRELAGEDSVSDEGVENSARTGRKRYGPRNDAAASAIQINGSEFEEHQGSDDGGPRNRTINEGNEPTKTRLSDGAHPAERDAVGSHTSDARTTRRTGAPSPAETENRSSNPFLTKAKKEKHVGKKSELLAVPEDAGASAANAPKARSKSKSKAQPESKPVAGMRESTIDSFLQQRVTAADDDGWATVLGGQDEVPDDASDANGAEDSDLNLDLLVRNQALTAKGFAGDNVAADFAAEKWATIADEEASETTSYLPGWGSWTGSGLSLAEARNKGHKTVTTKAGVDASMRKDRKLDKVIINERRVRPNVKYMASQLPFPFESREQYERSLRVPKGKEWTTKKTFQDATRPRVMVKQGVIAPLRKPLV